MKSDIPAIELPQIAESDVRQWAGEGPFTRGWGYFRSGHILDPCRQGVSLRAKCLGISEPFYRVDATLGADGIAEASCTCPVGHAGRCKHVAALLLTWVHQPEAFRELEDLQTSLARRNKTELIAIIRRMLARVPELEDVLELPIIGEGQPQPVDLEVIRRQVARAFESLAFDPDGLLGIARRLDALVDFGADYEARGDCLSAFAVYRVVAQEVLDRYISVPDEEGDIALVVSRCTEETGECLEAEGDPATREAIFRMLFDVFEYDTVYGPFGMSENVLDIVLEHATAEERQTIACWVREAETPANTGAGDIAPQEYGRFLLELEADTLDDETFIRRCRETRRWQDLIDRLLSLGRTDEAVADARNLHDYDLLRATDLFLAHGLDEEANRLVRERASDSGNLELLTWLKARAESRADVLDAFALAEELFWRWPSLPTYSDLREAARRAGEWERLPHHIVSRLRNERRPHLLVEIYLSEGEVADAIGVLRELRAEAGSTWSSALAAQVAEAAEEGHPDAAIDIYIAEAEQAIAGRSRGSYQAAAHYLSRSHKLLLQRGEPMRWEQLIRGIRTRYYRLSALQDELDKAGL